LRNNKFNEVESTNKIKRGALMSYIAIAVNILAGLLYIPWMVGQIGKDNFGLYTLATSLISMFCVLFLNITQKEIKKVQITCLGSPIKFIF
jgi:O-antigen/teichoic acid export membrane protein